MKVFWRVDEVDTQKIKEYEEKIEEYVNNQTHCGLCEEEKPHLRSYTAIKDDKIKVVALCEKCHSLIISLVERGLT